MINLEVQLKEIVRTGVAAITNSVLRAIEDATAPTIDKNLAIAKASVKEPGTQVQPSKATIAKVQPIKVLPSDAFLPAEEVPAEEVPPGVDITEVTLTDIIYQTKRLVEVNKGALVKALFATHGIRKCQDCPPDKFGKLLADLQKIESAEV